MIVKGIHGFWRVGGLQKRSLDPPKDILPNHISSMDEHEHPYSIHFHAVVCRKYHQFCRRLSKIPCRLPEPGLAQVDSPLRVFPAVRSIYKMQTRSFSMAATFGRIMAADRGVRLLCAVTALLFLPMDFTQLAVAIAGACIYTFLQHASDAEWWSKSKVKTKAVKAPSCKASKASKAWPPALPGQCWEADVQFLLSQITPTAASEQAAQDLVETVKAAIQPLFPDADVCGFVSGGLEGSRAFRVAVPDIELVISISPEVLQQKLLGKVQKKLGKHFEKAAIRC